MNQPPLAPLIPTAPPVQPSWPSDLPPVALDERGCIAQDIDCRGCGYSLRGLPPRGTCPECSTPIGKSIHGDLLRFSDPNWVERVARGVQILVIAFIVGLVGGIALGAVVVMIILVSGGAPNPYAALIPFLVFALVLSALNIAGYWLATTRDPGKDESERPLTARALARWLIVSASLVGIVSVPFTAQLPGSNTMIVGDPTLHLALQIVLTLLTQALNVTGMIALLLYAGQLARRLPDDRLARHTSVVAYGYGIGSVITAAGSTLSLLGQANPGGALTIIGGLVSFVGVVPTLVFGIWAIVLLFKFRSRLRNAAHQARATWARVT